MKKYELAEMQSLNALITQACWELVRRHGAT